MLCLKELNLEDALAEYKFFQETKSENGFINDCTDMSFAKFINEYLPTRIKASLGIGLSEGYVPNTYYFLWDGEVIVGLFKLRHYLNEFLKNGSGHIGYSINPKYRQKGYATKGLALAIEKIKTIIVPSENEIYLSCNKDNIASLKVQLANGGYIHHSNEKENYVRIKID